MILGKKIYYDIDTGGVLVDTGEQRGKVIHATVAQDVETYKALFERNRDTFDYVELEHGQYTQDFAECSGYRINPETRELEFSYPDPNAPEVEAVFQKPLSEQVKEQEQAIGELTTMVSILTMGGM